MIKFIIFWLFIVASISAQEFSDDIIIDTCQSSEISYILPVIDVNFLGKIAISWTDDIGLNFRLYYSQSTDKGYSFGPKLAIDDTSIAERKTSYGVYYDQKGDIVILYYNYFSPWTFYYRLAKSTNQGLSFFSLPLNELSNDAVSQLAIINDSTYFLPLIDPNINRKIKILKSFDGGFNFNGQTLVDTDSGSIAFSTIPIFRVGNGDILCFWNSQYQQPVLGNGIYSSRSFDNGMTFGPKNEILGLEISPNLPSVDVYENFVFLTYAAGDSNGYPNVWVTISDDYGQNFDSPKLIYQHPGHGNFSPQPIIKFNPNVGLCLIWSKPRVSDRTIYFTYSTDFGNTFDSSVVVTNYGMKKFNSLTVSDSGYVYVVCAKENPSRVVLNRAKLPILTTINQEIQDSKLVFIFHNNYPNPFNPRTTIEFDLPKTSEVSLKIFNILGEEVATLVSAKLSTGSYSYEWDASNLASGVYLYRLQAGDYVETKKMVLMK